MSDGSTVWRHDTPNGKMAASPAVFDNELVVHGMDGHVWVLDRYNGRVLWRYYTGSPIESSPVVIDGIDYFGDWAGAVYALDLRTHRARWTYRTGNKITSSASFLNGTVFIGDYGGRLLALGARNGRLRWSAAVNGRIYGTPAVASGRVFAPSSTGNTMNAFSTRGQPPLDAQHRRLRLLVAGGLARARLLRLLQRRPLLRLGGDGRACLALFRPAARSGAPRRSWTASSTSPTASTGSTA